MIFSSHTQAGLVECIDCDWQGTTTECYMLGKVGPLCPECKEIVESSEQTPSGDGFLETDPNANGLAKKPLKPKMEDFKDVFEARDYQGTSQTDRLIQNLKDLRYGTFKDQKAVNDLIDETTVLAEQLTETNALLREELKQSRNSLPF